MKGNRAKWEMTLAIIKMNEENPLICSFLLQTKSSTVYKGSRKKVFILVVRPLRPLPPPPRLSGH